MTAPVSAAADVGNDRLHVVLSPAPPIALHGEEFWRTDGNSPVLIDEAGATVFFSHYEPRGRTFRRRGARDLRFDASSVPVRLIADPDPTVGKWIEAVWRHGSGRLYGWYHAEELAPCTRRLFVPHIGRVVSDDGGLTWQCKGELLRAPANRIDCGYDNGFFAGGYGDFSIVADRDGRHLYLPFTSYVTDERAQGIVFARLALGADGTPAARAEIWHADAWRVVDGSLPFPLWPVARGWRHADPDSFWGPVIHYNRALGAYVMLLNRTQGGARDMVQEGIYVSVNESVERADGWSAPLKLVQRGAWYPQIVGSAPGDGDSAAGAIGRFFMAGFSAWEIALSRPTTAANAGVLLHPTQSEFHRVFGADRKSPW